MAQLPRFWNPITKRYESGAEGIVGLGGPGISTGRTAVGKVVDRLLGRKPAVIEQVTEGSIVAVRDVNAASSRALANADDALRAAARSGSEAERRTLLKQAQQELRDAKKLNSVARQADTSALRAAPAVVAPGGKLGSIVIPAALGAAGASLLDDDTVVVDGDDDQDEPPRQPPDLGLDDGAALAEKQHKRALRAAVAIEMIDAVKTNPLLTGAFLILGASLVNEGASNLSRVTKGQWGEKLSAGAAVVQAWTPAGVGAELLVEIAKNIRR